MVVEVFAFVVSHRKGRANVVCVDVFLCFVMTYSDFGKNGKYALNEGEYNIVTAICNYWQATCKIVGSK